MKTRLVLLTLIALTSSAAWAAPSSDTFYVKPDGNDSRFGHNAGGQAWATLAHAVQNVSAGDTIYVAAGTYTDEIIPTNDGTSGNPITVIADTTGAHVGAGGPVILRRSGTVLSVQNDDHWTFRGFTIERTNAGAAVSVDSSTGLVLEDCTLSSAGDTVHLFNGSSATLTGCTISSSGDDGIDADGGAVTVSGSTFPLIGDDAIALRNGAVGTIDACRILDGSTGINIVSSDATITNTLIADTGMTDGITVSNAGSDVAVVNCTIWGVSDDGIDGNAGRTIVRNCIFSDIGGNCMEGNSSAFDANTNLMWQYGGSRSSGFNSPNEFSFDPGFADEGAMDFSLAITSGAIDAGLDMSSYTTTDIAGVGRPVGAAFDLGAFERAAETYTAADVPYTTDFSTVGDEWVGELPDSDLDVGDFIGPYGDTGGVESTATLYLNTTPGVEYSVRFDLLTIDSWDGTNGRWGTDALGVLVDGSSAFSAAFDHRNSSQNGYGIDPDATGNWGWGGFTDGRFDDVTFTFTATGTETQIVWQGALSEGISNESWGLLGVRVDEVVRRFSDATADASFGVDTNAGLHDGSGWHWADFDGDGDLDAFVGGASAYLMRYNDVTGVFTPYFFGNAARGYAVLDADDDGDPDLYYADGSNIALVENFHGVLLNRGDAGIDGPSNAEAVVAMDVDADGTLELLVTAQNGNWLATNQGEGHLGHVPVGYEDSRDEALGLNDPGDAGNGDNASSADVNNDGYLDVFVNYGGGKLFFSNGDGTFREDAAGISVYVNNNYKFGSAWGDYDNDGDMDLFVPDARSGQPGSLWRNSSNGTAFTNVAASAGITSTDAMRSAAWGDFDNDGDLDLYITTEAGVANLLYSNNGDGTFTLVDEGAGLTGDFQDAVFVDYDADGDLDIALSRLDGDGRTVLLENSTDTDAYLKVRLVGGDRINNLAIGSRVELYDASGTTLLGSREIGVARGYGGTEPLWAHFGGVDPDAEYLLRVVWPGGESQTTSVTPGAVSTTIGSITTDQMITIEGNLAGGARFVQWRETDPTE
ncbi:MAG: FG-GAP-like repeat-containing protein [Phycisphaerales bacterium]